MAVRSYSVGIVRVGYLRTTPFQILVLILKSLVPQLLGIQMSETRRDRTRDVDPIWTAVMTARWGLGKIPRWREFETMGLPNIVKAEAVHW